ncbi:hypothetical protein [Mycobacterium sp. 236(2023)]|uniref:hypothetical protein n=1 Tax=Mycobacterium sp. 236(2023) TaxID=3038163 RepID=UPI002414EB68|nr:hypothetical protein [Mycobacterium sp. 236(2023)]MDG4667988.1 hypothetical protein [Mycobacterium sp. 236(2023)]
MADEHIPFEKHTREWWSRLSDEQRATVRAAAAASRVDEQIFKLLATTRCPVGPIGTAWEAETDYSWSWPHGIRTFVASQPSRYRQGVMTVRVNADDPRPELTKITEAIEVELAKTGERLARPLMGHWSGALESLDSPYRLYQSVDYEAEAIN